MLSQRRLIAGIYSNPLSSLSIRPTLLSSRRQPLQFLLHLSGFIRLITGLYSKVLSLKYTHRRLILSHMVRCHTLDFSESTFFLKSVHSDTSVLILSMSKVCPNNNQIRGLSPSKDHMSNEQDTPLKSLKSRQNSFLKKSSPYEQGMPQ